MLLSAAHLGFKMFSFSSWWRCCRCSAVQQWGFGCWGPTACACPKWEQLSEPGWTQVAGSGTVYAGAFLPLLIFQVKNQDGKGNLLFSFKIWINVFYLPRDSFALFPIDQTRAQMSWRKLRGKQIGFPVPSSCTKANGKTLTVRVLLIGCRSVIRGLFLGLYGKSDFFNFETEQKADNFMLIWINLSQLEHSL